MKPGTYKIVNIKSGTAITENHLGIVGWSKLNSKNQQWFVQESGKGYRFKNAASGGYLALASTTDSGNKLFSGDYPSTWALVTNPGHRAQDTYGIIMGDTDRMLDLVNWGSAANGTEAIVQIYAYSRDRHKGSTEHRTWKFERISDETGEESPGLAQAQEALSRAEKLNQTQATEIEFLRRLLLDSRQATSPQQPVSTTTPDEATFLDMPILRRF